MTRPGGCNLWQPALTASKPSSGQVTLAPGPCLQEEGNNMRKTVTRVAAVVAVCLLAVLGGGAYALASTGSGSTINGCVQTGGLHNLSVPPAGQACPKGTAGLSWNTTGPAGPAGPRGAQGQAGLNGQNGVSVESQQLAPGNGNCPNGGAEFTAFDGNTFACTGGTGPAGTAGAPGPQAPPAQPAQQVPRAQPVRPARQAKPPPHSITRSA